MVLSLSFPSCVLLCLLSLRKVTAAGFPNGQIVRSCFGNIPKTRGGSIHPNDDNTHSILDEKVVYSGWRKVISRSVRMRNGRMVNFDLVGVKTDGDAVLVFAWDTRKKTATLIKEYMPGPNKFHWGLAAGLIESKHGDDPVVAAQHELEEECHLGGGEWIALCENPVSMDKYSLNGVRAYLVLDPSPVENPKPLDAEEDIEIYGGITIPMILDLVASGEMNAISGWGCLLAIQKLRQLGEEI